MGCKASRGSGEWLSTAKLEAFAIRFLKLEHSSTQVFMLQALQLKEYDMLYISCRAQCSVQLPTD